MTAVQTDRGHLASCPPPQLWSQEAFEVHFSPGPTSAHREWVVTCSESSGNQDIPQMPGSSGSPDRGLRSWGTGWTTWGGVSSNFKFRPSRVLELLGLTPQSVGKHAHGNGTDRRPGDPAPQASVPGL